MTPMNEKNLKEVFFRLKKPKNPKKNTKGKVLHVGHGSYQHPFRLGDDWIESLQRYLGCW